MHEHEVLPDGPGVVPRPERDPDALAGLARLYNGEPAVIDKAATAAEHAYEH